MADEMVLRAQRFINTTYNNGSALGIPRLTENGQTGWPVMYAPPRAPQYELGITSLSDSFGPTALGKIGELYGKMDAGTVPSANFCRITQSALYCKGYDGGEIDGTYNDRVEAAVAELHQDVGVEAAYPGGALWPKTTKGLFNMDAYVTVGGSSDGIRSIQQWLNGLHLLREDFYVIPCDGHHSRDDGRRGLEPRRPHRRRPRLGHLRREDDHRAIQPDHGRRLALHEHEYNRLSRS